jgi:hypothetical protein
MKPQKCLRVISKVKAFTFVITLLLITSLQVSQASEQQELLPGSNTLVGDIAGDKIRTLVETNSVIRVTDENWSGYSTCTDCSEGWASDIWELTLTKTRLVTFSIEDCCIVGDYYELWIDGKRTGTTEQVELWGDNLSTGQFAVTLKGGTHQMKVRDSAFDTFSPDVLNYMCPAGFYFSWELGESPDPWWQGAVGALKGAAKQLAMGVGELIARLKGLGDAWDGLVAAWQLYKAGEVAENLNTPDYRAKLIDEAYNNYGGKNVQFRSKVDIGVGVGCDFIGCTAESWNDLTYDQKRNDDIWLGVCSSVGGGFCSSYLLPTFASKWLE